LTAWATLDMVLDGFVLPEVELFIEQAIEKV
jgi:hypothetical protein